MGFFNVSNSSSGGGGSSEPITSLPSGVTVNKDLATTNSYLNIDASSSSNLCFLKNGTTVAFISSSSKNLHLNSEGKIFLSPYNATKYTADNSAFYPYTDNAYTLGMSGRLWSELFVASGTISTSDRDAKMDITETTLGLDFINDLRPVEFKFKVRQNEVSVDEEGNKVITPLPGVRTHAGLIAQEVEEALDGKDIGLLTKDSETGQYGLRYEEFIAPLVKAVQELSAKAEQQEIRIAELEAKLEP